MSIAGLHCVVVGAGHAAAQLCVSLRQAKWPGRITVVGDEPAAPYHRPPLSKSHLVAAGEPQLQMIRPVEYYASHQIELKLGHRARSIRREARVLDLGSTELNYDALVLATGSLHRRPPISGIDHARVFSLRTAADAQTLREHVRVGRRAAIIGAGFIGLEVAASLRNAGVDAIVLEMADRVLSRVTSPAVSAFFESRHRARGVDLRTGALVKSIRECDGRLTLGAPDGAALCEVDFIVVGAGAAPNDELARLAGLEVNNGILVDERNRTSDPAIYAMGDCCNQFHPMYECRLRLESVQNATDQAKAVAAAICQAPQPAPTLPWFWSDQYDLKLMIAGISTGYDRCAIRGTPAQGPPFSAWYLRQGRLIAVDTVNDPRAYVLASKLIPRGVRPDPDALADPNHDPKHLLNATKD